MGRIQKTTPKASSNIGFSKKNAPKIWRKGEKDVPLHRF